MWRIVGTFQCLGYLCGDTGLARDAGLTDAAAVPIKVIRLFRVVGTGFSHVPSAGHLIVAFFRDSIYRASFCTRLAGAVEKIQAVRVVIGVWPFRRWYLCVGHNRSNPNGLALGSNECITQAECAQP